MLKHLFEFIKKEKAWVILFLLMAVCYGLIWERSKHMTPQETEQAGKTPALDNFKKMETRFQEKLKDPETMKRFAKEKPGLALLFNLMVLFVAGAITAGIVIDLKMLTDSKFRNSIARPPAQPITDWHFSMIFKVILLYMAGSFVVGSVLGIIRRFGYPAGSENFFLLTHTALTDVLVFVFVAWVIQQSKGDWRDIGFHMKGTNFLKEIWTGICGYAAVLPIFLGCLVLLLIITNLISYEPPAHPLVNVFLEEERRSPWLIFYSIFLAVVIGPIFEELFFRGLCYSVFRKHWGVKWAAIVTAVFFAAIHGNVFAFFPIFILGLCLAYLYEKRGSLIACMTLHVIHNIIFLGFFFLGKNMIAYAGS